MSLMDQTTVNCSLATSSGLSCSASWAGPSRRTAWFGQMLGTTPVEDLVNQLPDPRARLVQHSAAFVRGDVILANLAANHAILPL
jgi:hypothetical protein